MACRLKMAKLTPVPSRMGAERKGHARADGLNLAQAQ